LCQHILAHFRWHLQAHLLLGQAYLEQENWTEAYRRFRIVQIVYPESAEAGSGLAMVALAHGNLEEAVRYLAHAFENAPESDEAREALQQALSQQAGRPVAPPAFTAACVGRFYLRRGLPQPAAEAYAAALRNDPDRVDLRLAYATALWKSGIREQAADLCQPLLERTPRPLTALLLTAAEHFRQGQVKSGQEFWMEARAWDPDDSHAHTLFGQMPGLPFTSRPAVVPIPQDDALSDLIGMASQVGAQQAASTPPAGQAARELATYAHNVTPVSSKSPEPADPDLRRFRDTVEQIHDRLFEDAEPVPAPPLFSTPADKGRRLTEVILTSKEGLHKQFGAEAANQVHNALKDLTRAVEQRGMISRLIYLDQPPYPELPQPNPSDPQQIKTFLDELDRRLGQEGLDFHYLLLIGGDRLVPFARLPNPSEDGDETVPSDNLYASRDPTYLIPERAVGRIPDDGSTDASQLLEQLALIGARQRGEIAPPSSSSGCLGLLLPWLNLVRPKAKDPTPPQRRFGLSAQVWAAASEKIFEVLPGKETLHLCPPTCRQDLSSRLLGEIPFAYFNLHGAADSPHWYGQRDLTSPGEGPLMPIAFSPSHIPSGQVEGVVVYSEACYGAHILNKDARSSIALRFLSEGALGVVGSTVISYGVSVPPLTDADLLGLFFWQHLLRGKMLGDALLQAKIDFTREMYRRQGYLDGDDMKTLIEFVLYGDPLATVGAILPPQKTHETAQALPMFPVLCEKHAKAVALHHLSGDLVARVRRSLTWLHQGHQVSDLQVTLRTGCPGDQCRGHCKKSKGQPEHNPEALVFTSERQVETEDGIYLPQLARVVVDTRGRIVKMAVTR
jgi:Flp pilus assembly protein TadD